ncbi:MAG: glucosamine-6-phosphate deaminase [Acidobacteriaceae bacterium]
MSNAEPVYLQAGNLKLEIYADGKAAGTALANAAAEAMRRLAKDAGDFGIIFATGVSQLDVLNVLTSTPGLPWDRTNGFHLDEYLGLPADHPASFRRYMRQHLTQRVQIRRFFEIDGTAADPALECMRYGNELRNGNPQLCFLGIGANGHLAFNDPNNADFQDPQDVKIVELDPISRRQQLDEGWFHSMEEVPERALTVTLPAILRVHRLMVAAPGRRKAAIVRRMIEDPISTACPATILRTHPNVTVFLDQESASELSDPSLAS